LSEPRSIATTHSSAPLFIEWCSSIMLLYMWLREMKHDHCVRQPLHTEHNVCWPFILGAYEKLRLWYEWMFYIYFLDVFKMKIVFNSIYCMMYLFTQYSTHHFFFNVLNRPKLCRAWFYMPRKLGLKAFIYKCM
jgi:hypothetical protein